MKQLLIMFALLGRVFATNPCAEHNIYLSESAVTVSTKASARCTPGIAGGIQYNCPRGSGGMTAWGFDIQSPCVTEQVSYAVRTLDNSALNHYDLGLYYIKGPSAPSLAGQLIVHTGQLTGTAFTPYVGLATVSWAGTANCSIPCTLPAGQYALALATDCSAECAVLWGDGEHGFMYLFNVWLGGSQGTGVNPALVPAGCPSGNPASCTFYMATAPGLPNSIGPPATDPALSLSRFPEAPIVLIF
ncbi:MAG: hypothetical protein WAM89_08075 [Terriglobales bacterium]